MEDGLGGDPRRRRQGRRLDAGEKRVELPGNEESAECDERRRDPGDRGKGPRQAGAWVTHVRDQ